MKFENRLYVLSQCGGFHKTMSMKVTRSYLVLNMPAPATLENSFGFSGTAVAQIMNPPSLIYSKYFTQQLLFQFQLNCFPHTRWTNVNLLYFPDSIEAPSRQGLTLQCSRVNQSKQPFAWGCTISMACRHCLFLTCSYRDNPIFFTRCNM